MQIYYRISDSSYSKLREVYITKEKCLSNLVSIMRKQDQLTVVADNISEETYKMIIKVVPPETTIHRTQLGHGALSFNFALQLAVEDVTNKDESYYFVEDDYLHTSQALDVIEDGLTLGFDYITGYDHPDKYIDPLHGGNPVCLGGAESTRVYLGKKSHFKITNSTTMTFAAKKYTLLSDYKLIEQETNGRFEAGYPYDFYLFNKLYTEKKRHLGNSIPGVCTHGETKWLSPFIDWSKV